ncbi:MAG: hypothetical protein QXL88_01520 [Candidatus Pacearchaeota archaeon]
MGIVEKLIEATKKGKIEWIVVKEGCGNALETFITQIGLLSIIIRYEEKNGYYSMYATTLFSPKDLEYLNGIEISVMGKLIDAIRNSVHLKAHYFSKSEIAVNSYEVKAYLEKCLTKILKKDSTRN